MDLFHRLAPALQDYIYTQGWTELRPAQAAACQVIFDTDAHLLLAAGTAAGKTEAAFLPLLSVLHQRPSRSVGALYISPLKALIDDQFARLRDLLRQSDLPVVAWHGDSAASGKQRLLAAPDGILQTTPESLESLLLNRAHRLPALFGDLQFVVIDELHALMDSPRGQQLQCQLVRLARAAGCRPRRIGLSATVGDRQLAGDWLAAGTERHTLAPEIPAPPRPVRLGIAHFQRDSEDYHRYLFQQTRGRKSLIFTNNRAEAEAVIANLRHWAQAAGEPDYYHVHHGSVAAELRSQAEQAMQSEALAVTAATLTLEMGIDLGRLERVIQIDAPTSVASWLQRLGRTGRRGHPAEMRFACTEPALLGEEPLPAHLPWQLLQAIAAVQLYLEDRWVEPSPQPRYPFSLLYQQTLSILAAQGEQTPADLARAVLTLPCFAAITPEDFRQLLHHWLALDHLQQTERGALMLGLAGEQIVRHYSFYAVFADRTDYAVWYSGQELGRIVIPPTLGLQFALAGRYWRVTEVDRPRQRVFVQPAADSGQIAWRSSGSTLIHNRILARMRQVLQEETVYPYLTETAQQRLQAARHLAQRESLASEPLLALEQPQTYALLPWLGTPAFTTLAQMLATWGKEFLGIRRVRAVAPYYFILRTTKRTDGEALRAGLVELGQRELTTADLVAALEVPRLEKYDEFIPESLLRRAYGSDRLELATVLAVLAQGGTVASGPAL